MTHPIKRVFFCLVSLMLLLPAGAADLKTCRDIYQKSSEEILQTYQPKFTDLQNQYQKSLDALKTFAQGQGDLTKTKAAVAEINRFQKAKTLPASLDESGISEIKALQSGYVKQYTEIEKEMATKLSVLAAKYEKVLALLQKELVKAGKLDEATAVQSERDKAQAAVKGSFGQMPALAESPAAGGTARSASSAWVPLDISAACTADIISTDSRKSADQFTFNGGRLASASWLRKNGYPEPGLPDDGRVQIPGATPSDVFQVNRPPAKNAILLSGPEGVQPRPVTLELAGGERCRYSELAILHCACWGSGTLRVLLRYASGATVSLTIPAFSWGEKGRPGPLTAEVRVAVASRDTHPTGGSSVEMLSLRIPTDPQRMLNSLTFSFESSTPPKGVEKREGSQRFTVAIFAISAKSVARPEVMTQMPGGTQEPLTGASMGTVPRQTLDLLALTDPVKDCITVTAGASHSRSNNWERHDKAITYISDGGSGKIMAPVVIKARSYEIEVGYERLSGSGRLHADLPIDGLKIVPVYLDAPGFGMINSRGKKWPAEKGPRGRGVIRLDRALNGTPDRITVRVDGEEMVNWTGDINSVIHRVEAMPHQGTGLYSHKDSYKITAWTLRIFEGEATVLRKDAPTADTGRQSAPGQEPPQSAATQSGLPGKPAGASLAFTEDGQGNLVFNTGVVKGSLKKDGQGDFFRPISFIDPPLPMDNNRGLLVPYRFLTPQKRFGFGSWEWPRTGRILANGAAELAWAETPDRPFRFTATYAWEAADTLDFTVVFTPGVDLEKFELFVGSYFKQFTKAVVYVRDAGDGKPGFVDTPKEKGGAQLFPRGDDVMPMIQDGRWKHPPYPNNWTFRQTFQAPLGVKSEPKSGVAAIIMAPPEDCFAVSMFEQNAGLGCYYLSLFGKDVKKGQTLTGHARMVFGKNITDGQAIQKYQEYLNDLK